VRNAHARQDTFFFKTTSHTASPDFQTDARGSEANLPSPGVRPAFQDVRRPDGLIRPHYSLITIITMKKKRKTTNCEQQLIKHLKHLNYETFKKMQA
jgi:hypothetical protein